MQNSQRIGEMTFEKGSKLQHAGFDMRNLSIIGKGFHESGHSVGYYNAGERMKYWGEQGAFWDDLWGMLYGSAFFSIPDFGPILVGGPIFASILGALEGGLSKGPSSNAIGEGIHSMGVPSDSVAQYESALKMGMYLVISEVFPSDTSNADDVVAATLPALWNKYERDPAQANGVFIAV